jgi:tetratricopeptide (TPR) repeat protein
MGQQFIPSAYLELAKRLADGSLSMATLPHLAAQLPALDRLLLDSLATHTDHLALGQPKQGWAVAAVAEAAAILTNDPFLQALAAWYVARAGNAWVRPDVVATAVTHARDLFTQLGETGWLAACDWQQNALPWTRPNFQDAAATLTNALYDLQAAGFDHLVPHCRLSLAYAHLLIGNFAEAAAQTDAAAQTFQQENNLLGLAYCLFTRGAYLRRQTHFEAARDYFTQAMTQFQELGAPVQTAVTTMSLGQISWWWQHDFRTAESKLKWAAKQFEAQDLPLWLAQSQFGLGQIYQQTGQLAAAGKAILTARETFAHFHLSGLWADSLLDSGWLALYQGQYQTSLDYFRQAESLYTEIGNHWLPVVAIMHQGEAHLQMGWYQRALQQLEDAHGRFTELSMPQRIAACEMRLAQLHLLLSQYAQSHTYLDDAEAHYQECGQTDAYPIVYNLRAELFFLEQKKEEAVAFLQKGLALARQQGDKAQIAQAQRLLGQALCASGRTDEAYAYLQTAEASFAEMGMFVEQAACQVAWGLYHQQLGDILAAQTAWESALTLSQNILPEISWQAQAGLATLSMETKMAQVALAHYREMVKALARLRQGLWQPSLASSFLMRPLPHLDTAVRLAAQQAASINAEALFFMEAGKAQIAARQLTGLAVGNRQNLTESQTSHLADLTAEINWLQENLRAIYTGQTTGSSATDRMRWQQQLVQKVKTYDRLKSRLERQHPGTTLPDAIVADFNQEQFRRLGVQALGQEWLSLNYYLDGEVLCGVALTPVECLAWTAPVTGAIRLALQVVTQPVTSTDKTLTERSLLRLGDWLFPAWVQQRLTPETTLILSPHQQLHRLPWPLLHVQDRPLVTTCIPTITPSLQALAGLWQRPSAHSPTPTAGLLLAVSTFQGRHQPLPAVATEAAALAPLLGATGHTITDTAATWPHLQALAGAKGLAAHYTFWHIATHAFYDGLSGRFSGVALSDRDIWLDEVQQLGPLPPLVTLSACSGGHSLVYAGDEHISLTLTCLAAGAQSVVSSLWPVRDEAMPELMQQFYHYYAQSSGRAALALALAQRDACSDGRPPNRPPAQWGALQCFGCP